MWEDKVEWLLGALNEFYWTRGEFWGWNKGGNRQEKFLVITKEIGEAVRQIFIPEGP